MKTENDTNIDGIPRAIYKRRWKILAAMCTSLLLVSIGNTSLNQIIPILARELSLSSLQITWIVEIYPLLFAGLLFTASAVADRYGRKKVMQLGMVGFIISTLYAALAANTGSELILARAVMGISAAMIMPTTLSIIENVFPKKERPRAIAIWTGIAGGGIALGSIATGFLIEHYSWHSVFFFSAGLGLIALLFNQLLTPESRDEKQTPVDVPSGFLSTVALLGIIYGIIEAPSQGITHSSVMAALAIGILAGFMFIRRQFKLEHPMLDMKLFKNPSFSIAALSITLAFFGLMGIFFSISQVFQLVLGLSPLQSSLRLLPIMLIMVISAPLVPTLVKKFGTRWIVSTGLLIMAIGFIVMAQWPTLPSYWQIFGSMAILIVGMSLTMTPSTNMMMSAIPKNRAGMGSAMNDTTRELGGALGIAVLGSILSSAYSDKITQFLTQLPEQVQAVASNSLAGALIAAQKIGPNGMMLANDAKAVWMDALTSAMIIAAIILVVTTLAAFKWLPKHKAEVDDENLQPVIEG